MPSTKHYWIIVTLFLLATAVDVNGQYSKFSYHSTSPILYNSAFAGAEKDKLNISSKFKRTISNRLPYSAIAGSVNSSIGRGFRKKHWFGVAMNYFSDSNRINQSNTREFTLNLAYHIPLNQSNNTVLSIGAMIGQNRLKFGESHVRSFLDNVQFEIINGPPLTEDSYYFQPVTSNIYGMGILLKSQLNDRSSFELSLSRDEEGFHVRRLSSFTRPGRIIDCEADFFDPFCEQEFDFDRPTKKVRFTGFLSYTYQVTERSRLLPRVFIVDTDDMNIQTQMLIENTLTNKPDMSITGGIGATLFQDYNNFQLFLGMNFKGLSLVMSYDTDFSDQWRPTRYSDAFECSLAYSILLK